MELGIGKKIEMYIKYFINNIYFISILLMFRGIVKHLDSMSDERIMGCNLPTGIPFVYELDEDLKVQHVAHSVPQGIKVEQKIRQNRFMQ